MEEFGTNEDSIAVIEARWPACVALALVLALLMSLPARFQFFGFWFPWVVVIIGIGSMVSVALRPKIVARRRIERVVLITIAIGSCLVNVIGIVRLTSDILATKHGYSSLELIETAAATWVINVLVFGLLFWMVDRSRANVPVDFKFADEEESETVPRWRPRFMDYFFLAFATSTSFTPPDYSRPASHRAKAMVMLQAVISLVTLFLIASRAVATL